MHKKNKEIQMNNAGSNQFKMTVRQTKFLLNTDNNVNDVTNEKYFGCIVDSK